MRRKINSSTMPRTHESLAGWPIVLEIPVQWGELDAYGHVNNTVFFRYFESARIAFLDAIGMIATMETDGVGAILHSTSCRFRRPLFHPDTVLVGGRARDVGEDRFVMDYRVVSLGQDAVAADGEGLIVCFDYRRGEKTGIPESVRVGLERMNSREPGAGGREP